MKNFGGLRKGDNIKVSAKARGVAPGEGAEIYKTRTVYVHSIYDQFIVLASICLAIVIHSLFVIKCAHILLQLSIACCCVISAIG